MRNLPRHRRRNARNVRDALPRGSGAPYPASRNDKGAVSKRRGPIRIRSHSWVRAPRTARSLTRRRTRRRPLPDIYGEFSRADPRNRATCDAPVPPDRLELALDAVRPAQCFADLAGWTLIVLSPY